MIIVAMLNANSHRKMKRMPHLNTHTYTDKGIRKSDHIQRFSNITIIHK